jgi:hypothetical protein
MSWKGKPKAENDEFATRPFELCLMQNGATVDDARLIAMDVAKRYGNKLKRGVY